MRDPERVCVTGPLASYRDGFVAELVGQGYVRECAARQLALMAHVSAWLESRGLGSVDLTPEQAKQFLSTRRAEGHSVLASERALRPLLGYLDGLGVLPPPPSKARTPATMLLEDYRRYLASERGLANSTVTAYLSTAELFLCQREQPDGLRLQELSAREVSGFVVEQCRQRRVAAAKVLVVGLRSLLRFLFLAGHIPHQLASVVPTPAGFAGGSLPRALDPEAVAALLGSCALHTEVGRRDFAIMALLARLGLRAGEVAALALDDLDWRRGEIVVRGKGGRQDRMPIPADVGEARVGYLQQGRPRIACRAVFVRVHAPIGALNRSGVADVVAQACKRAGLPRVGPHRLRHSAATAMLRGGASLTEVGQVLRQVRTSTTAIYAKVDRLALRALAQPWPEEVA
jgi:site-specific recombinase XerD